MPIFWLNCIKSTQAYLIDEIKQNRVSTKTFIVAKEQTQGRGSRDNEWISLHGNLFFSFCIKKNSLPKDLPLSAGSIYFSFILKKLITKFGSKLWIKWPNDFYINDTKIGGTITNLVQQWLVCGIGINLVHAPKNFATLDIKIDKRLLLFEYEKSLKDLPLWKNVLKEFQIEFLKSKRFFVHVEKREVSLANADLADDGALIINGQRIYSLR